MEGRERRERRRKREEGNQFADPPLHGADTVVILFPSLYIYIYIHRAMAGALGIMFPGQSYAFIPVSNVRPAIAEKRQREKV